MTDFLRSLARGGIGPLSLAAAAIVFCVLAVGASVTPQLPGDLAMALTVQGTVPAWLIPVLRDIAVVGETKSLVLLTLAASALFFVTDRLWPARIVLLTFFPDGLNFIMKHIIQRPRPEDVQLAIDSTTATGFSFPSGHTVFVTVFFGLLAVLLPSWWRMPRALTWAFRAVCVALIVLVGIERIATGVHWPTDVLGAYAIGLVYLHVLLVINRRYGQESPSPDAQPPS